jgi:hypothetical protein
MPTSSAWSTPCAVRSPSRLTLSPMAKRLFDLVAGRTAWLLLLAPAVAGGAG